ncbi:CAP domain-containing protein [Nonomuraea insulae]|uniref:CAP domain-containing protein n=1 Tax=Nonomuraea insulae TaxID=1616787 RepID=A0ABW1CVQ2_9ACTN
MAKPHVGDTLKIQTSAARRGCFNSALLRIRVKRVVPGPDPVVKSGATKKGRLTLSLPCKSGTYYATVTDYRGHSDKSRPVKLTCTPGSGTPTPTPSTPSGAVGTAEENEVVRLTNAERAKGGCGPLKHDPQLNAAAHGHSAEMAKTGRMTHDSQDGSDMVARMRAAGFTGGNAWAENVAEGQRNATEVLLGKYGWMNSSGHRANIMNCRYNLVGVGAAKSSNGTIYWTQDFAAK